MAVCWLVSSFDCLSLQSELLEQQQSLVSVPPVSKTPGHSSATSDTTVSGTTVPGTASNETSLKSLAAFGNRKPEVKQNAELESQEPPLQRKVCMSVYSLISDYTQT